MPSERNNNMVPSLQVKSNAGDNADVILWADPSTHRLLVDATVSLTIDAQFADDAAFTVGTSKVLAVGMLADETATDSIDEGDVGIPRMTLARKQIMADDMADDAAWVAAGYVSVAGFVFDDTTPDSVDEGDVGYGRMSGNRNIYVTLRDAAGNERGLNVDASGQIAITHAALTELAGAINASAQMDVNIAANGIGLATSAKQDTIIGHLDGVEGLLTTIDGRVDGIEALLTSIEGDTSAIQTAVQLIDDAIFTDDAAFTPATSKLMVIGATADETAADSVDEGDAGALRMTLDRRLRVASKATDGPGEPTIDSYTHAAINLNAGADQVLASSAANKQIWVYGISFVVNAAGTVSFQDEDNTAITGIMPFAANSGLAISPSGNFAMPIWKLATDKDLEVDIVTSELDGFIDYAVVSV